MPYLVVVFKAVFMCAWAIIIRGTLPRYRFDQLTYLTWKHFIFIWFGFICLNISLITLFL